MSNREAGLRMNLCYAESALAFFGSHKRLTQKEDGYRSMITRDIRNQKDVMKALTNPINLSVALILSKKGELSTMQICTQLAKQRHIVYNKLNWLSYLGVLTRRDKGREAHWTVEPSYANGFIQEVAHELGVDVQ